MPVQGCAPWGDHLAVEPPGRARYGGIRGENAPYIVNYLAHSALADYGDAVLLGSLLGDAWRGLPETIEDPEVRIGLILHRRLDLFTDSHRIFRRSRKRLAPGYRRYAGIIVDVFYDHFLARYWPVFRADPAEEFAHRVYQLLAQHRESLPAKLQRFEAYMRRNQLLTAYADVKIIEQVLRGLSGRLSRDNPLAEAAGQLAHNQLGFKRDLFEFYPEAVHASRQLYRQIRLQVEAQSSANSQPVQA